MRKIMLMLIAGMILAAAAASSAATAAATSSAHSSSAGAKIELRKTKLGKILVNARGFTLFMFAADPRGQDKCVQIKFCTTTWPVVKSAGAPVAGHGVKRSLLGTIHLPSGVSQATYAGHPLYTYTGDSAPGQTSYVGISQFGARWYALAASGKRVK